jgi:hypothetical protein
MDLATSCSMDIIDRLFNLVCFVVDLKYDLISFSLPKLRSQNADVMGNVKNI